MSYVESSLSKDEQIVYSAKLHWAVFLWPSFLLFIAIISFRNASMFGFFIIATLFTGLTSFFNYVNSEFCITTKRVVLKTGVIQRNSTDVLLSKIEGAHVDQGILGRILNYGTLVVGGTGGTKGGFKKVANPMDFRKAVQNQIDTIPTKQTVNT